MASDSLKQVGKVVKRTRQQTKNTSEYYSRNIPVIERNMDTFNVLDPYIFEFYTYDDKPSVSITIRITEGFRAL